MAWSKPYTADEVGYIKAQFGRMSSAEIAEKLGRSVRGVNNKARELGLRRGAPTAPAAQRQAAEPPEPRDTSADSTLADLLEARALIRAQMLDAGPQALARLSAEYREVLAAIDARREGPDGSVRPAAASDGGIGQILLSFGVSGSGQAPGA